MMRHSLIALASLLLVSVASAQQKAPPPWADADEKLSAEAWKAYEEIKPAVAKLDYEKIVKTIADNRRPLLPKKDQTDEKVAALVEKLKLKPEGMEKTKAILADVDAAKPKAGKAKTQEIESRGMKLTLVKISLPGTASIAEKHKLGKGGWTGDDEGNVAVLMVRHEGTWFWNPFGW